MILSNEKDESDRPQPGTLLWIGTTSHREIKDAFKYCSDTAAQLAVRRGIADAINRPAGFVRRIIFARPSRYVPDPLVAQRFLVTYPDADSIAICGQLCDGEGRTGTPWPVGERLRFSRWQERLPRWLEPCTSGKPRRAGTCDQAKLRNLLVIADRFDTAEPLLLWADSVGLGASWHRRFVPALHSRFDTILWDDSVAPATSAAGWKERLVDSAEVNQAKRHLWMSLQPSADEIAQASCGGISRVLSKPLMVESILAAQSISPQRTGRQSGGKRAVDIVTRRVSEGPHFAPRSRVGL